MRSPEFLSPQCRPASAVTRFRSALLFLLALFCAVSAFAGSASAVSASSPVSAVTVTGATLVQGNQDMGTVTLSAAAPAGGITVTFAFTDSKGNPSPLASAVPVTVPAGATTAPFTINAATSPPVTTATAITVTATGGGGSATTTVNIVAPTLAGVTVSAPSVLQGGSLTGTVTLTGPAPPGGLPVTFTFAANGAATALANAASITVPANATTAPFTITTATSPTVTASTAVTITATGPTNAVAATFNIVPPLSGVNVNAATVIQGNSLGGTVTLSAPAPSGGTVVGFSFNSPLANAASVTVPAGATTASFTITTSPTPPVTASTPVTVTATAGGVSQSASFFILPPPSLTSLTLDNTALVQTDSLTGTVTLNEPAPTGGTQVNLALTDSTGQVAVPSYVVVPQGASSVTFPVTSIVGAITVPTPITITASLGNVMQTATFTLLPTRLTGISLDQTQIQGGGTGTGTVTLQMAAPAGGNGITINLSVTDTAGNATSAASTPASVTVLPGQTSASFTLTTSAVAQTLNVEVTAQYVDPNTSRAYRLPVLDPTTGVPVVSGGQRVYSPDSYTTGALTVLAGQLLSLSLNPTTIMAGTNSTGTVTLSGSAPLGGAVVNLFNSNTGIVSLPATVVVPAGQSTATFTITPHAINATTSATITATLGNQSFSQTLTVQPVPVVSLVLTPALVAAGQSSIGTVSISTDPNSGIVAPPGGLTIALSVTLPTGNTSVSVPASVNIPAGAQSATFTVTTTGVAATEVVPISANLGPSTKTASLTVQAGVLAGFSLNPTSVIGSQPTTGTVTLNGQAPPGGLTINLSSNAVAARAPVTVVVPAGQSSVTFTVNTNAVTTGTTATITAFAAGSPSLTATLAVQPAGLTLTVSPSSVVAGNVSTGTVALGAGVTAPADTTITLSSDSAAAVVPASVVVRQGASSATFTIHSGNASSSTIAHITATLAGLAMTQPLTVMPNAGLTYPAGFNMISLPYNYGAASLASVFGFSPVPIFVYNPSVFNYNYPSAPTTVPPPGQGFFVYFPKTTPMTTVTQVGTPVDQTQPFMIRLSTGWNQIGDPFLTPVPVSGLSVVSGSTTENYSQASTVSPLLLEGLFGYTPNGNYYTVNAGQSLAVGQGYWLYATRPLTLVMPAAAQAAARH